MKIIALLPMKDEAWILSAYLSSVVPMVDEVIAVDNGSSDDSRAVVQAAGGLVVPARPWSTWTEQWGVVRNHLLELGREHGGTHFVWLDGDEALTTPFAAHIRDELGALAPGEKLAMRWLTLWQSPMRYRDGDGSQWSDLYKDFAVADDGRLRFVGEFPHNVGRTPGVNSGDNWRRLPAERGAVLHYQFAAWRQLEVKQAWYRCAELIAAPRDAFRINDTYRPSLDDPAARCADVPPAWVEGIAVPPGIQDMPPGWRLDEILGWFDEHGIAFFEPLQIWHVPELHALFLERVGREPRPKLTLTLADRVRRRLTRS